MNILQKRYTIAQAKLYSEISTRQKVYAGSSRREVSARKYSSSATYILRDQRGDGPILWAASSAKRFFEASPYDIWSTQNLEQTEITWPYQVPRTSNVTFYQLWTSYPTYLKKMLPSRDSGSLNSKTKGKWTRSLCVRLLKSWLIDSGVHSRKKGS